MGRLLGGKEPAKNIAAAPPTKNRVAENGDVVTEKLCPMPSLKMINPRGMVVNVPIANGISVNPNTTYRSQIERQKIEAGFVRYDLCPVGRLEGWHETAKRKRCAGKFSREECCPHVKEIIAQRRETAQRKAAKFAQRFETTTDALVRHLKQQNAQAAPTMAPPSKVPR